MGRPTSIPTHVMGQQFHKPTATIGDAARTLETANVKIVATFTLLDQFLTTLEVGNCDTAALIRGAALLRKSLNASAPYVLGSKGE